MLHEFLVIVRSLTMQKMIFSRILNTFILERPASTIDILESPFRMAHGKGILRYPPDLSLASWKCYVIVTNAIGLVLFPSLQQGL